MVLHRGTRSELIRPFRGTVSELGKTNESGLACELAAGENAHIFLLRVGSPWLQSHPNVATSNNSCSVLYWIDVIICTVRWNMVIYINLGNMKKETMIDGEKGGLTLIMHCGKHSDHQLMSVSTEVIPPPHNPPVIMKGKFLHQRLLLHPLMLMG
jgi:hypothetical protein